MRFEGILTTTSATTAPAAPLLLLLKPFDSCTYASMNNATIVSVMVVSDRDDDLIMWPSLYVSRALVTISQSGGEIAFDDTN